MARYTGSVCRLCRRMSEKLFLKGERCFGPKCAVERRAVPPGGRPQRRRKLSERGLQLKEKQKSRFIYGVLEAQFRRHFAEAQRRPGITGENLLQILERRLDNVTYRLGFADSRKQARQLVNHGHCQVNGRKTDISSYIVKEGDVISWVAKSKETEYFKMAAKEITAKNIPPWLSLNVDEMVGRVITLPSRSDVDYRINEQLITEYYSR
ncbi:MAG: 30S ribosomal protein S4 [Chloroflexi bacterium]|nr:30S ribosomal protein S4 [Chloroflexota bacterium]